MSTKADRRGGGHEEAQPALGGDCPEVQVEEEGVETTAA